MISKGHIVSVDCAWAYIFGETCLVYDKDVRGQAEVDDKNT